ncbi:MAG: hypothetical protein KatS3mg003_1737 [Candidatus Nitrosocaldaceae archaeon]|nr:MAG: hypothetical protein KatS3mg003_1737 [Candidatus Nitrosocaldaceae archaeon]
MLFDNNPYPLTPIAGCHGKMVAYNIINGNKRRVDYKGVPSVVFITPLLASVGLREDEIDRKVTINKVICHHGILQEG